MLGTPSVVNEISFFRGYVVLWIRLFSTDKTCHLTGPSAIRGRSTKVLCCSLKFVRKLDWKFSFGVYILLTAEFPRYFLLFSPTPYILTHQLRAVWLTSSRSSPANRRFEGTEVVLIWGVRSEESFSSSRKQKGINDCKDYKSTSVSLVILKLITSTVKTSTVWGQTRTDRFVWGNISFEILSLSCFLSFSPF